MKALLVAAVVFCLCGVGLGTDNIPRIHKFSLWGSLQTENDKVNFFTGFTNGLLVLPCNGNPPPRRELYECVLFSKELDLYQAISMIDKYYKENPEKWGTPIGIAIMDALTVSGGPCAGTAPKK